MARRNRTRIGDDSTNIVNQPIFPLAPKASEGKATADAKRRGGGAFLLLILAIAIAGEI